MPRVDRIDLCGLRPFVLFGNFTAPITIDDPNLRQHRFRASNNYYGGINGRQHPFSEVRTINLPRQHEWWSADGPLDLPSFGHQKLKVFLAVGTTSKTV